MSGWWAALIWGGKQALNDELVAGFSVGEDIPLGIKSKRLKLLVMKMNPKRQKWFLSVSLDLLSAEDSHCCYVLNLRRSSHDFL